MTNNYNYYIFFDLKKFVSIVRNLYDAGIAPVQGIHSVLCGRAYSPLVITGVTMESATVIRQ